MNANKKFIGELLTLGVEDLIKKRELLKEEHFKMRCNKIIGQLTDTSQFMKTKRNIARINTIISLKTNANGQEQKK